MEPCTVSSNRLPSFGLTHDDRAVLEAADEFARKEFQPLSRRMDDEEWGPPEIFGKIGAAGFMGAAVSPHRMARWDRRPTPPASPA